jgi:hypothetical protein
MKKTKKLVIGFCVAILFGGTFILSLALMVSCSQKLPDAPISSNSVKASDVPVGTATPCGSYPCFDNIFLPCGCYMSSSNCPATVICPNGTPTPVQAASTATFSPTPTLTPILCNITGSSNLMFNCSNGGQVTTLQSAVSPSGGTYNWQILSGGSEVQINGSNTASSLTLQAIGPSSSTNDIEVQLTYTLNSQNAGSTHNLTVQQPSKVIVISPPTITAQPIIGGQGECLGFRWGTLTLSSQILLQVQDQFGNSFQSVPLSEQVSVDTTQTSMILLEDAVQYLKIKTASALSVPYGYFYDDYEIEINNDSRLCNDQNVQLVETQELNVGGCIGINTIYLSPTGVQTSYPINLH